MTFFSTDFNAATGEGQGAPGDSGGGVFIKSGGTWELAGTILYIGEHSGQPQYKIAAAGNLTYMADLSVYRDQIINLRSVTDVDEDNIPDDWEYEQTGSAKGVSAEVDEDGDSMTGYEEYLADTDPTDGDSIFRMDSFSVSVDQTVTFNGSMARQYQLFYTTNNLAVSNLIWTAHGNPVWGTGTGSSITVTNAAPAVFYRLRVTLP